MPAQHTRATAEGQRVGPREAAQRRRAHLLVISGWCVPPPGYYDVIAEKWWPPFASKRRTLAPEPDPIVIYGARLMDELRYRYVGQSSDLDQRVRDHRQRAREGRSHTRSGSKLYTWMREVGIERVVFDVLDRVPEGSAERAELLHITRLRAAGHVLLNTNTPGHVTRGWKHRRGTRARQRARALDRLVVGTLEAAGAAGCGREGLPSMSDRQRKASLRRLQADGSVVQPQRWVFALARLAIPVADESARPPKVAPRVEAEDRSRPDREPSWDGAAGAPGHVPLGPGPTSLDAPERDEDVEETALLSAIAGNLADVVEALRGGALHRRALDRASGSKGGVAMAIRIGLVARACAIGQRVYWQLADEWREVAARYGVPVA